MDARGGPGRQLTAVEDAGTCDLLHPVQPDDQLIYLGPLSPGGKGNGLAQCGVAEICDCSYLWF